MEVENLKKRIKRLEVTVVIMVILLCLTSFSAIFCAFQVHSVASKIPDYHELKSDVKKLNELYKVSEQKLPEIKKGVTKAYDYTKEKTGELIDYVKEKTKKEDTKHEGKK